MIILMIMILIVLMIIIMLVLIIVGSRRKGNGKNSERDAKDGAHGMRDNGEKNNIWNCASLLIR